MTQAGDAQRFVSKPIGNDEHVLRVAATEHLGTRDEAQRLRDRARRIEREIARNLGVGRVARREARHPQHRGSRRSTGGLPAAAVNCPSSDGALRSVGTRREGVKEETGSNSKSGRRSAEQISNAEFGIWDSETRISGVQRSVPGGPLLGSPLVRRRLSRHLLRHALSGPRARGPGARRCGGPRLRLRQAPRWLRSVARSSGLPSGRVPLTWSDDTRACISGLLPACIRARARNPCTTSRRFWSGLIVARLGAQQPRQSAVHVTARREPLHGRNLAGHTLRQVGVRDERIEAADRPGIAVIDVVERGPSVPYWP